MQTTTTVRAILPLRLLMILTREKQTTSIDHLLRPAQFDWADDVEEELSMKRDNFDWAEEVEQQLAQDMAFDNASNDQVITGSDDDDYTNYSDYTEYSDDLEESFAPAEEDFGGTAAYGSSQDYYCETEAAVLNRLEGLQEDPERLLPVLLLEVRSPPGGEDLRKLALRKRTHQHIDPDTWSMAYELSAFSFDDEEKGPGYSEPRKLTWKPSVSSLRRQAFVDEDESRGAESPDESTQLDAESSPDPQDVDLESSHTEDGIVLELRDRDTTIMWASVLPKAERSLSPPAEKGQRSVRGKLLKIWKRLTKPVDNKLRKKHPPWWGPRWGP
ncbi:hypothetical protein N7532_005632 [Penicillium argentinense]|uniref:Uncharacterized protein n=1 Tax=Penicillium argentinense TaxID=1131581 RepID=A0A9W9FEB7_9EURO|nr:uncharacterized protein N7532_005632 [Penicillium argentinense]KAJ5098631.1 hypothetical protein N7532_005632 [Penicillium argentinense]